MDVVEVASHAFTGAGGPVAAGELHPVEVPQPGRQQVAHEGLGYGALLAVEPGGGQGRAGSGGEQSGEHLFVLAELGAVRAAEQDHGSGGHAVAGQGGAVGSS